MRMGIGLGVGINRSNYAQGIFGAYATRVVADGGTTEAGGCVDAVSSLLQSASLLLIPSGYKGGKLYAEIPTNGNGDLTWTRGSDAFRTNASGLIQRVPWNLFGYSEQFDNGYWYKNNSSITANTITAPNGTLTADSWIENNTNSFHVFGKSSLSLNSGSYVITIYAKAKERSKFLLLYTGTPNKGYGFDLANGTTSAVTGVTSADSFSITTVGDGWYRCQIGVVSNSIGTVEFTMLTSFSALSYLGDGTSGMYIWGAQLVEGTTAQTYLPTTDRLNFPRLSYMYGSCPSVLLEPQRTNLFVNSGWTGGGATPTGWNSFITGTTTAVTSIKNNSVTAYRFSGTSQRAFFIAGISVTSGVTYSMSVYVESVTTTGEVGFMLSFVNLAGTATYFKNGVSITGTTTIEAGYTYTMLFVPSATGFADLRIGMGAQGNATANYVLSMPQFEQGAYATTFILSPVGATATRVADSFSRNNIYTNGLITSSGGTWFVELRNNISYVRDTSGNTLFVGDNSNGNNNALTIRNDSPSTSIRFNIVKYIGGVQTGLFSPTTSTVKIAIKWNGTSADIFVNGVKEVSATAFATTNMEFFGCFSQVPTFIQGMALFPTPLTDTQCQTLTTL